MSINPFYLHGEELSPVRKLLFMKALAGGAPLSEYDATGNPLTFTTNVAKPLKTLVASFLPVQSGTGDPSPQNPRSISGWSGVNMWHTGKNLLDPAAKTATLNNDNVFFYKNDGFYLPAGTYTISASVNMTAIYVVRKSDNTNVAIVYNNDRKTFTLSEGTVVYVNYYKSGGVGDAEYMLEVGSSASAYTPYTGHSLPVTFPAVGKNLLNPANRIASGNNVQYYRTGDKLLLKGGQTYTISTNVTPSQISIFKGTNTPVTSTTNATLTYTPTEDVEVWIDIYVVNSRLPEGGISAVYGQLEQGSTATAYEPYTSTIYGGSVDLVTGVLTATWASIDMGKLTYTERFSYADHIFSAPVTGKKSGNANILSSEYAVQDAAIGNLSDNHIRGYASNENIWLRNDDYSTAASLKTGMDGVQLVYELATPLTYQLTPQQVTALGDNTIWSDAITPS